MPTQRVGWMAAAACALAAAAATFVTWRLCRSTNPVTENTKMPRHAEPFRPPEEYLDQIAKLRLQVEQAGARTDPAWSSLAVRLRFLEQDVKSRARRWAADSEQDAERRCGEIVKDLELTRAGKTFLVPGRTHTMGYWSDLDDSYQPYMLTLPSKYDAAGPGFPLLVYLHGQGMFNPLQCSAPGESGWIVAGPQGRGGMDYMFVGEADVLRVIAEVQRIVKVDPARIVLGGHSMGGTGCWHLATRYPEKFAGIAAMCGNTDMRVWRDLWLWRTPANSPQGAVRDFLREDTSAVTYAENLGNLGLLALHGEADPVNDVLHGRKMQERLKALAHPRARFIYLPFVEHGFSVNYDLASRDYRLGGPPARVVWKTAWLRYPGAYWLNITGLEERLRHAVVTGTANAADRSLSVNTANVSELALVTARLPFNGPPTSVLLDGAKVAWGPEAASSGGQLVFHKAAGGSWTAGPRPRPAAFPPLKSARVEGPVEHAFMSRFLLVTGDGAEEESASPRARAAARAAGEFSALWQARFAVPCRAKTARQVTPEDLGDSNLILFGGPDENPLVARVLPQLPLRLSADNIALGGTVYSGPNAGVKLCYPNPLSPERYVVLMAGATPESYEQMHIRFGNWFDWIPFDYRNHGDFAVFDDFTNGRNPESFLVWGFFDERWSLSPRTTFAGSAEWRNPKLPRVLPRLTAADWAEGKPPLPDVLYLDEVAPVKASITKEYMERNRTLDGAPLRLLGKPQTRGLCCRFPCELTFPCAGYARLRFRAGIEWDGKSQVSEARTASECATVTVWAGHKKVCEFPGQNYQSPPLEVDVDLGGAPEVTFSAAGGYPWLNGSFVWAEARLEK